MSYEVKTYDLKLEGLTQVTPHFKVREFACKDGSNLVLINPTLLNLLETIRNHFNGIYPGAWITINSGYRTVAYNSKVSGSSSESQHCYGNAADIVVKYGTVGYPKIVNPSEVADYVEKLLANTGGVGRYATFTHVDVRKVKARWRG